MKALLVLLLIEGTLGLLVSSQQPVAIRESSLLISTLDGTLHAVGQRSGLLKWSLQESPLLKLPSIESISQHLRRTLFLPDPKDGSLYLYTGISDEDPPRETLKKLPFTISEIVSTSPCRSSDGLLYTGKKIDEWMTINAETGEKVDVLNSETPMCPTTSNGDNRNLLFVGKSEYHLSIFDLKTKEKTWNLTFVDYSSSATISIPQNSYDMLHLTSSTTGRIATIDLSNDNTFLWTHQFMSPIVAIFQFNDGNSPILRRVPFSTIGGAVNPESLHQSNPLFPSLYVGEMNDSKAIYALSTLVDITQTALMPTKKLRNLMLEGPNNDKSLKSPYKDYYNLLVFGYYEYPEKIQSELIPQLQITQTFANNLLTAVLKPNENKIIGKLPLENLTNHDFDVNYKILWPTFITLFSIGSGIFIALIFKLLQRNNKKPINDKSLKSVNIGKISYDPKAIIGRGCSGTIVYKGLFENKQNVAVKRVIADYFVLADREIELLRTLQHTNLIRYYATESDDMFRYIAIELAEFTLADYVEGKSDNISLNNIELLHQSSHGLAHLHSLNIIHRDIKPHNILISLSLPPNQIRKVMISDFGVSKILTSEHSFSTGLSATLKGTEGWIAPEVLKAKIERFLFKPSKPIDIFSLGCLFYYVLTKGQHPFGDKFQIQSNILERKYDIDSIKKEETLSEYNLIQAMINHDPMSRPEINNIVKHPLFWDASKSLQFLQDVSDRIEKEAIDSQVVIDLERGGIDVCRGDWRRHISIELQTDLKKFRSYKGSSARDLLRAMRNKRHHYRELPPQVQESLGSIPNQFVTYFTSRFPRLLAHTYMAMQSCKHEDILEYYYENNEFKFEPLPRAGIKWFQKSADTFMPNGIGIDESLDAVNWKSCKRKGSPVKSSHLVPDLSPKFEKDFNHITDVTKEG